MAKFTPLGELPTTISEDAPFAMQLKPTLYVDQDHIGVNVNGIRRASRLLGLGGVIQKSIRARPKRLKWTV